MKGPKISIVEDCEGCDYLQILQCKKKCVLTNKSLYINRDGSIQPASECPFLRNKVTDHLKSELTKFENEEIAEIEEIIREIFVGCYYNNNGIEEFTVIQENSIGIKEIELCKEKLPNYELRIVGNEDSNSIKVKLKRINKND
jgi:hypothetical protein